MNLNNKITISCLNVNHHFAYLTNINCIATINL